MRVFLKSQDSVISAAFRPNIKFVSYIVGDICIPYTYYNVIDNTLLRWTSVLGFHEQLLGAGQYDILGLLNAITIAMENIDASLTITWEIDPTTGIIIIKNGQVCEFDASDPTALASNYLGFAQIVYTGSATYGGFQPYNIRRTCQIHIQSNLFSGLQGYDNIDDSKTITSKRRFLDNVVVDDKNLEITDIIVKKREINGLFYPSVSKMMNNIEMKLLDDNGDQIFLNSYEWSIELIFLTDDDILDIKKVVTKETYTRIHEK